ncbi:hypothetical protein VST7929_03043 [Vibrio stylophorae]|jgi:hypothetical protein|uniref:DUF3319 domain-containing protein n=1 Tax=Vibrio stylophorae TaxID=659351 RepID=A0ABM8ZXM0_9VIBR|nr:DUF3319 domain-containing protein [Vibrio stylophorae]CAH0535469.1 hypothetical protein VST7929_03043 [Vibrio stylophorae]
MKMRSTLYRGYLVERLSEDAPTWRARLNNRVITGRLTQIKSCIDWWVELNIFVEPNVVEGKEKPTERAQSLEERHNGFVIKNDSGAPSDWYLYVRGRVIKGKLALIKQLLDQKNIHADASASAQSDKKR